MNIGSLNNLNNTMEQYSRSSSDSNYERIENILKNDPKNVDGLKEASKGFEEFLLQFLIAQMRQTVPQSSLFGDEGRSMEIYTGMLDEQIAKVCAENGSIGISRMIEARLMDEYPDKFGDKQTAKQVYWNKQQNENDIVFHAFTQKEPQFKNYLSSKGFALPLMGEISSPYGKREDPFTSEIATHYGVDISAEQGTSIKAIKDGKVIFSGTRSGYGNVVVVKHTDGYISLYAHTSSNEVEEGDMVKRGQVIARVGSTGRSTGSHLHLEIYKDGDHINPLDVLPNLGGGDDFLK
jgi:murein DD-endopeptidase MepM/ murein hydrolase activator NlpD